MLLSRTFAVSASNPLRPPADPPQTHLSGPTACDPTQPLRPQSAFLRSGHSQRRNNLSSARKAGLGPQIAYFGISEAHCWVFAVEAAASADRPRPSWLPRSDRSHQSTPALGGHCPMLGFGHSRHEHCRFRHSASGGSTAFDPSQPYGSRLQLLQSSRSSALRQLRLSRNVPFARQLDLGVVDPPSRRVAHIDLPRLMFASG